MRCRQFCPPSTCQIGKRFEKMHSVLGMVPVLSEQTLHSPCSRGATQHRTQKTDYIITQLPQELGSHVICILTCWKTMQKKKTHIQSYLKEPTEFPLKVQSGYSTASTRDCPDLQMINSIHFISTMQRKMEEFQGGKDIDQLY